MLWLALLEQYDHGMLNLHNTAFVNFNVVTFVHIIPHIYAHVDHVTNFAASIPSEIVNKELPSSHRGVEPE